MSQWEMRFEGAARLKRLASREWMDKRDMFGFKNPYRGEIGWVRVIGNPGEHFSMALNSGPFRFVVDT